MGGVRVVAQIWGFIGWLGLIAGSITLFALLSQLERMIGRGGGGVEALAISLAIPLAWALGPFSIWAVLTGLCEIHDRQKEMQSTLRGAAASTESAPLAEATPSDQAAQADDPDAAPKGHWSDAGLY